MDVGGLSGVGRGASVSAHGSVTNLGAYQEMTVDTGGAGAENKEGGVRLQFIPRDGGNRTSGSMILSYANSSM